MTAGQIEELNAPKACSGALAHPTWDELLSLLSLYGVEGMERELLYQLLSPYADAQIASRMQENPLSKVDFYIDGLTGGADSATRRDAFAAKLGLPPSMTPNALLAATRMLCTYDEYLALVGRKALP